MRHIVPANCGNGELRMETELLTVRDVSRALKVSTRQIWKLLAGGRMPKPIRIGRSVRWPVAVIERWIDELHAEGVQT